MPLKAVNGKVVLITDRSDVVFKCELCKKLFISGMYLEKHKRKRHFSDFTNDLHSNNVSTDCFVQPEKRTLTKNELVLHNFEGTFDRQDVKEGNHHSHLPTLNESLCKEENNTRSIIQNDKYILKTFECCGYDEDVVETGNKRSTSSLDSHDCLQSSSSLDDEESDEDDGNSSEEPDYSKTDNSHNIERVRHEIKGELKSRLSRLGLVPSARGISGEDFTRFQSVLNSRRAHINKIVDGFSETRENINSFVDFTLKQKCSS